MEAKKIVVLLVLAALILGVAGCGRRDGKVFLGITQIEEHPALDAARQGFIDGLAAAGYAEGDDVRIEFQSAQGEITNAQLIAENFVAQRVSLILAISTPSAQMAFQATRDIPILITAVTDPVQEGLAKSWAKSGTNVTGTSDSAPMDKHVELIQQLLPRAKRVGVLYNTSEANSQVQVDQLQILAEERGLEVVLGGVTAISDIPIVLGSLLPQVDVLYTPTDNLVVSAMGLVAEIAGEQNTPIIGSEESQVYAGALATHGIDYYRLGQETAALAVEVLRGASPQDMGIMTLQDTRLLINTASAQALNIAIPAELAAQAEFVGEGQ